MHSDSGQGEGPLDIIFISYSESNADKNWLELKRRFPRAKRVHGVKGIREAHMRAAEKAETTFFFVVDGDNRINKDFRFERPAVGLREEALYVYRCYNPVNDLVYGYGAIKIYNKSLLQPGQDKQYTDFATRITQDYVIIDEVASSTHFFHTSEEAWRGAFREAYKLSSQCIDRQNTQQTLDRLVQWCESSNEVTNAAWVLLGARQGRDLASQTSSRDLDINNFDQLQVFFNEHAQA